PVAYSSRIHAFQAWDLPTARRIRSTRVEVGDLWFGYSCYSRDGRLLVIPGGKILDTATGKAVLTISVEGKLTLGMPVAISHDGAYVAESVFQSINKSGWQGTEMVAIQIWELATLLPVARLQTGPLAHLTFTPDNRHLITAGPDKLQLWDVVSAKVLT